MRSGALCMVACILLAGCAQDAVQEDTLVPDVEAEATLETLRFAPLASAANDTVTVTVSPQDACVPAGCNTHLAAGGAPFLKFIDVSHIVPVGAHVWFEAEATWDEAVSGDRFNEMNLQWWCCDMWVWGGERSSEAGRAVLSGHISRHGPEALEIVLVVIEPEHAEPVDVEVALRVTPLEDRVAPWHPVGVRLSGPTTIEARVNGTLEEGRLQVRGPDDALVADAAFDQGTATVELPENASAGEYVLHVQGDGDPVTFHVGQNLTKPLMRVLDVAPNQGQARTPPSGGEPVTWTVDLDRAPYYIAVRIEQLDRWAVAEDLEVRVEGPRGDLIEGGYTCGFCGFTASTWSITPGADELVPGTYTFTASARVNAEFQVFDVIGTYVR